MSETRSFEAPPGDDLVYDRQDMFYVPFAGLQHVSRPGPNFEVYARRDVALNAELSTSAR